MPNFVWEGGALPGTKTDSEPLEPSDIPAEHWTASDVNTTFAALIDIKNALWKGGGVVAPRATPPTVGTFAKGDVVMNSEPSTGPVGWVCTVAGTPGTWASFGELGGVRSQPMTIIAEGEGLLLKGTTYSYMGFYPNTTTRTGVIGFDTGNDVDLVMVNLNTDGHILIGPGPGGGVYLGGGFQAEGVEEDMGNLALFEATRCKVGNLGNMLDLTPERVRFPRGSAPPSTGTYNAGDLFFNDTTPGTNVGWVCTVAGTPGTWASFGPPAGGGGVTDHGALTGLSDDDHTQYLLATGARDLTGALRNSGVLLIGTGSPTTGVTIGRTGQPNIIIGSVTEMQCAADTYPWRLTDGTHTLSAWVGASAGLECELGTESNHALTFYTNNGVPQWGMQTNGDFRLRTASTHIQFNNTGPRLGYRSEAPTTGAWIVGDLILNTGVTSTTTPGWMCTTAGTPGTWTALPVLGGGGGGVTDHGVLTGLSDDDHPQYAKKAGDTFSGLVNADGGIQRSGAAVLALGTADPTTGVSIGRSGQPNTITGSQTTLQSADSTYPFRLTDGTHTVSFWVGTSSGFECEMGTETNHDLTIYTNNATPQWAFRTGGDFRLRTTGSATGGGLQFNNTGNRMVALGTTSAPASGTWATGDIVWSTTASVDGPVGWRCTSGGTPGTWKAFGYIADELKGTATWNPASVAAGASASVDVTVTGAALGDYVVAVGHTQMNAASMILSGVVRAANTVSVTLLNRSGAAYDMASGTVTVIVRKAS